MKIILKILLNIIENLKIVIPNAVRNPVFMGFLDSSLHFVSFRMTFFRCFLALLLTLLLNSCQQTDVIVPVIDNPTALVTFVELGSDRCEQCLDMIPVMDSLKSKYSKEQLEIIFIDVYKQFAEAQKYNIQVIPSQIFFDDKGKEFHRHEGFYPEVEIDSLLQTKGLKIIN